LLVFENYPIEEGWELGIGRAEAVEKTNYPLVLVSVPGERLHVRLQYDGRLFEAATVERMAGHLGVLLAARARAPEGAVRELPLLSEAERAQLRRWNQTGREHPQGRIHELFEAQVARTPEAVALEWGSQRLTYAELNRRANRLGHRLRELG